MPTGSLRSALRWIALAAVVAFVLAGLASTLTPRAVRASSVARVAVQPTVADRPATTAEDAGAIVVGLAGSPAVLDAAARADPNGAGREEVADRITVERGAPGFVVVAADAPTAAGATALFDAVTPALAAELARSDADGLVAALGPLSAQMTDVANQLRALAPGDPSRPLLEQRYGALAAVIADRTASPAPRLLVDGPPTISDASRSSVLDALLAALVVAVVGVLVAVAVDAAAGRRSRRRTTGPRDPGLDGDRPIGAVAVLRAGDDAPAVLTRLYAEAVRDRGPVYVVQLSAEDAHDLGADLAAAARIVGDTVTHRDLTPVTTPDTLSDDDGTASTIYSLRRPAIDDAARALLRPARAAVLAIDSTRSRSDGEAEALSLLEGLGLEVRGTVVWRGRLPRDPAWSDPGRVLTS